MQKKLSGESRWRILSCLVVLGLLAAVIFLPNQFISKAGSNNDNGLIVRTSSQDEGIVKMYDIREDKDQFDALLQIRNKIGKSAVDVADVREGFVRGEEALKQQLPTAKVEYNLDIRTPEIITPDVYKNKIEYLTAPSNAKRTDILRNFITQHNELVGVTPQQINQLKVTADYTNPDGNLSFVDFEQQINGIPVFRGEVKAGFTKNNEIIRIVNNLAPGLDYGSLSTDFRNPFDAVKVAATHIKHELTTADRSRNDAASTDQKVIFGEGDWATTAEKMYFPTEPGIAVPAWRILIWQPVNAYYVIVDAETGVVLWHKNITDDQTQSATYDVYANSPAYINAADHAAPLSPGPNDPGLGTQGILGTRINRTFIGNEGSNSFNNNGWITDGANITDGNATEAGIDRVAPNGVDAPLQGDTACPGAGCRVFTSTWNPPPGNPGPGDDPLTAQAQRGAVIQMFYLMNLYHDELYKRGFNEAARNFQNTNFSGMGVGNDRVSSEGQDSSGSNNANFATPADGGRGRMQMYIWTGPTPDRDGTPDADIVIHEVTHGTSNRMHGNGTGLGNQGRMMGEGWGDWYAHTMLAEPTDPVNGVYGLGGYSLFQLSAGFTANHYYGIRRFPTALIASTGGPNNRPHNPLTFGHINSNCDTTLGTTTTAVSSAYPRSPVIGTSGNCSQVHNAGEIWKSALWEVRALMLSRLGFTAGTTRVLDVVTNGMKMAPLNPDMLQERDAIIATAAAMGGAGDVADIREGFRRRGFGFSASVQSASAVTEAFDFPNIQVTDPFSVSDSTGNNNGFPEPGEAVLLSVAITNTTGTAITNVVASVVGGGSANYGTIADGATVTRQIPYTIPASVACGSLHTVTINASSDAGTQTPVTREFRVGVPVGGAPATFSNTTTINLPAGQPGSTSGVGAPYPSDIVVSGLSGNKVITLELTRLTHTFPADLDFLLVGPGGQKYIFASDSGGGGDVSNLNISFTDGAAAQPSTTQWVAGEFRPVNIGANDLFAAPAPAAPYANAPSGGTDSFASVFGTNGSTMNGTWSLYAVDDAGGDFGSMAGWKLTFGTNDYTCGSVVAPSGNKRADFDGDGKTDLSVFRPSDGSWYINRSTDGFTATTWGASTDTLVPADYDGDGKTDIAVFRPSNGGWYYIKSSDNSFVGLQFGQSVDIPMPGDFEGDGKADINVFRPSNGFWYRMNSSNNQFVANAFGQNGDKPLTGDFNGDGKADLAVFRPSNGFWYIAKPTGVPAQNFDAVPFGFGTDLPTPADYDGDGKTDIAIFRPSAGSWYYVNSSDGQNVTVQFGQSGDIPVPGDYDGDGKYDQAIVRSGTWYLRQSTNGLAGAIFGNGTDKPIPKSYIP